MKCIEKVPTFSCFKWDGGDNMNYFTKRWPGCTRFKTTVTIPIFNDKLRVWEDHTVRQGDWVVVNDNTDKLEVLKPAQWRKRFEPIEDTKENNSIDD